MSKCNTIKAKTFSIEIEPRILIFVRLISSVLFLEVELYYYRIS